MLRADEGGPETSQGAGMGQAGLTGIRVSQEGILVLAASQRDRGRRLILRQPREAGDAHVVHRRVSAQGRAPGEGHGNPPQYSCLESHGGAWQATVHGVARS